MSIQDMKVAVYEAAVKAYRAGLMAGTSGNFSLCDPDREMVAITPSGLDYEEMEIEDITLIDFDGKPIESRAEPSSEWRMHTTLYKRLSIQAIAHTHAPYATSFSVLNEPIPTVLIEMALLGGEVPVAPFAMSGTEKLGIQVADTLQSINQWCCLLQNHGTLAVGQTMEEAYMRSIYLEDAATIYHHARAVGVPRLVSDQSIQEMMKKIGMIDASASDTD